jgi:hypothetical protein
MPQVSVDQAVEKLYELRRHFQKKMEEENAKMVNPSVQNDYPYERGYSMAMLRAQMELLTVIMEIQTGQEIEKEGSR